LRILDHVRAAKEQSAATLWGQAFSLPPGFRPALPGLEDNLIFYVGSGFGVR
jgi:hypothetical protein